MAAASSPVIAGDVTASRGSPAGAPQSRGAGRSAARRSGPPRPAPSGPAGRWTGPARGRWSRSDSAIRSDVPLRTRRSSSSQAASSGARGTVRSGSSRRPSSRSNLGPCQALDLLPQQPRQPRQTQDGPCRVHFDCPPGRGAWPSRPGRFRMYSPHGVSQFCYSCISHD